jgi:hypothetical protein
MALVLKAEREMLENLLEYFVDNARKPYAAPKQQYILAKSSYLFLGLNSTRNTK